MLGGILKQETTVFLYCLHLIQPLILDDFGVCLFLLKGDVSKTQSCGKRGRFFRARSVPISYPGVPVRIG